MSGNSSTQRRGFAEKAEKDRRQTLVLAAVLTETEPDLLERALKVAPQRMRAAMAPVAGRLIPVAAAHAGLQEVPWSAGA